MATLAATAVLSDARLFYQDDSTAGNALTDAQLYEIINEVYQSYAAAYPERFVIRADSKSTTFTSGVGSWVPTNASFNVRRVLAMRIGTTNLERFEPHRIYEMMKNDATAGTPTRYALIQDNSSATMTVKPNTYTVLLYPIPADGAQVLLTDFEHYPIDLSAGTDLLRGLGDAESRWIPRLVAAKAAWLNGKDQAFIGGILDGVDKDMLAAMNVKAGLLAPRQRPGEVPV
jgi:hypothetical protein